MGYPLLQQVNDPQQLKALPADRLEPLCEEIRQFLIENVSKTGGHLSSNLGTIEHCGPAPGIQHPAGQVRL